MPRAVRNARLDTRSARGKLPISGKPRYCALGAGVHVGYRKNGSGGKWVVRLYRGKGQYLVETLASADDRLDANGDTILTFHQAQDRARSRMGQLADEARIACLGPTVTVRDAVDAYVAGRTAREAGWRAGRIGLQRDAYSRLGKHVILAAPQLAALPLAALTTRDLASWRANLDMAESSRRRAANDFRAALNGSLKKHRDKLPATLRDVISDGLAATGASTASSRTMQVLPDSDVRRIIAAAGEVDLSQGWGGDLARMTLVLAATGARFSQISRLCVADVQAGQGRLLIPTSRKGSRGKSATHIGVPVGPDVVAALRPAIVGRLGHETLLLRPRSGQGRTPWRAASELSAGPWAAIIAAAGLARGLVPYCLRHSAICRQLAAGLPATLVANLADTSVAMIQSNYGRFIHDALSDLAAKAVIPLVSPPAPVVSIVDRSRG